MMAKAGANLVVVMGRAHEATIRRVVDAGRDFGIKVMGDNLAADDRVACARWMESLGVDFIVHHIGFDERAMIKGLSPLDELDGSCGPCRSRYRPWAASRFNRRSSARAGRAAGRARRAARDRRHSVQTRRCRSAVDAAEDLRCGSRSAPCGAVNGMHEGHPRVTSIRRRSWVISLLEKSGADARGRWRRQRSSQRSNGDNGDKRRRGFDCGWGVTPAAAGVRVARGRDGRKWLDLTHLRPSRPSSLDRAPRGHARGAASSPFVSVLSVSPL